ncbi:hypothetical protein DEDE109153_11570 [Deinococcus deserti]
MPQPFYLIRRAALWPGGTASTVLLPTTRKVTSRAAPRPGRTRGVSAGRSGVDPASDRPSAALRSALTGLSGGTMFPPRRESGLQRCSGPPRPAPPQPAAYPALSTPHQPAPGLPQQSVTIPAEQTGQECVGLWSAEPPDAQAECRHVQGFSELKPGLSIGPARCSRSPPRAIRLSGPGHGQPSGLKAVTVSGPENTGDQVGQAGRFSPLLMNGLVPLQRTGR